MTRGASSPPAGPYRPPGTAAAIGRSLDTYYRDAARIERMDRLNARFVTTGALAFDIGAHLGDRTASFLRLGARVVAVEPQPHIHRALRLLHGHATGVTLYRAALGAECGEVELFVNSHNPTVSTASTDLVAAAPHAPGWQDQTWDRTIRVPMITLDRLIAQHGRPDFTKIDVEGFEYEALKGLSTALPALSFEVTTLQRAVALAAIERLETLGRYHYNLSLGEDHALRWERWLTPSAMRQEIEALPEEANSGDVFARLIA